MRVVAGEFKGRKLAGPTGRAARPTSDKVREALFSMLGDIAGLHVLDLFAGTGALGIEALSRGADHVTFVERDRRMATVIERNLATVGAEGRARLIRGDALSPLGDPGPFGLVFVDPPYAEAAAAGPKLATTLPPLLADSAVVVAESDRRAPLELASGAQEDAQIALSLRVERKYGDTLIRIFDRV